MRQATAKTSTPDSLTAHLEAARDKALASVRALLADDGADLSVFPREVQIERHLTAAESAARRLNLFTARTAQ